MKLEELVNVRVGTNITRIKELDNHSVETYSYDDLTDDLDGLYLDSQSLLKDENMDQDDVHLSKYGDIVFSFISSKAGIVSERNAGKVINQNFAKLIIEDNHLDPAYLCYSLNESPSIKKQMAISMQGSTIRKLTPATLKVLEMDLPTLEKQQMIGKAYLLSKKRVALARKEAEMEELYLLEILNKLNQ